MCAYKLVRAKFQVFGLQTKVESFIENTQWALFLKFHKELFTLIDSWYGLTMEDIRAMELALKEELDQVPLISPRDFSILIIKKLDECNLDTRDQKSIRSVERSEASSKSPSSAEKRSMNNNTDCDPSPLKLELEPNRSTY